MSFDGRISGTSPAQLGAVVQPFDLARAAQCQLGQAELLQFLQSMAMEVHVTREQIANGQSLIRSLNARVEAVSGANQALQEQVDLQRLENANLQQQESQHRAQVDQLAQRVEVIRAESQAAQAQAAAEQARRQAVERDAVLQRQRLEQQLQAQRNAAERANLQAELVKCEAALAKLNQEEADGQAALGSMGAWSGVVWGFAAGGPVGAALAGAAFGATGVGMGASNAVDKNAAKKGELNAQIQAIKARLLVLPQT